ncbi:hypothetical protein ACFYRJ_38470 [Streptomyces sp. NPDC005531]|uniref:hypothetical protein n=1 Tax=Streptomyces sp. NPDC005531 TaxID=3364722 RepID=UPI0036872C24
MTAASRMPMRDYLNEMKYAVEHILPTLWHEQAELRGLEEQVKAATARATNEYHRANFIMLNAEDPDDFMMGVGAHWDSYWGPDKDRHYLSQEADQLRARLAARAFSTTALAGAILQYGKQGLSLTYGHPNNWPEGRQIGGVAISVIIRHARNQAMHWGEDRNEDAKKQKPYKEMADCFQKLASVDPAFGDFEKRNLALEVVELLDWKEYSNFERDLLDASGE